MSGKWKLSPEEANILIFNVPYFQEPEDPKVRPIMRQLIIALNTPSQQVFFYLVYRWE